MHNYLKSKRIRDMTPRELKNHRLSIREITYNKRINDSKINEENESSEKPALELVINPVEEKVVEEQINEVEESKESKESNSTNEVVNEISLVVETIVNNVESTDNKREEKKEEEETKVDKEDKDLVLESKLTSTLINVSIPEDIIMMDDFEKVEHDSDQDVNNHLNHGLSLSSC